jgi:hypothetical protein
MKRIKHPPVQKSTLVFSNGCTFKIKTSNNTFYTDLNTDVYNHLLWSIPIVESTKDTKTYKGQQLRFVKRFKLI